MCKNHKKSPNKKTPQHLRELHQASSVDDDSHCAGMDPMGWLSLAPATAMSKTGGKNLDKSKKFMLSKTDRINLDAPPRSPGATMEEVPRGTACASTCPSARICNQAKPII